MRDLYIAGALILTGLVWLAVLKRGRSGADYTRVRERMNERDEMQQVNGDVPGRGRR